MREIIYEGWMGAGGLARELIGCQSCVKRGNELCVNKMVEVFQMI